MKNTWERLLTVSVGVVQICVCVKLVDGLGCWPGVDGSGDEYALRIPMTRLPRTVHAREARGKCRK